MKYVILIIIFLILFILFTPFYVLVKVVKDDFNVIIKKGFINISIKKKVQELINKNKSQLRKKELEFMSLPKEEKKLKIEKLKKYLSRVTIKKLYINIPWKSIPSLEIFLIIEYLFSLLQATLLNYTKKVKLFVANQMIQKEKDFLIEIEIKTTVFQILKLRKKKTNERTSNYRFIKHITPKY